MLINKKAKRLFIDQYGNRFFAHTVNDLRKQIGMGGSKVEKMYCDREDGSVIHTGYIIGKHWLSMYAPVFNIEKKAGE